MNPLTPNSNFTDTIQSKTLITWIALALNAVVLSVWLFALLFLHEFGSPTGGEIALMTLALITPIMSLVALGLRNVDTFLSLYFKRKALEERQRIKQLESK